MSPALRRLATTAAASALLSVGIVGIGEATARAMELLRLLPTKELRIAAPLAVRPHPFLGFCLREGATRQAGTPVEQRIGAHGYRGAPIPPKSTGGLRIVCLGDSTMYGDSLAEKDTIPAKLEATLRERLPRRKVDVLNAGVLQYSSAETFAAMALRISDLRPDVVVIYEGGNDVAPRLVRPFRSDYAHYRAVWERDYDEGPDRLFEWSSFFVASRWLIGIYPAAQRMDWYTVNPLPPSTANEKEFAFVRSSETQFARNQAATVALARASGARTLLCSPAVDRTKEGPYSWAVRAMDQFRKTQPITAGAQGGIHLDLTEALAGEKDAFRDTVHLTPVGARVVAARLCEEIVKRGW
ncbi:MAG: hypothetical protein JNJ88_01705 [Planctomycetes bacterium]|nr:hypothetical protein [Planctomycetota bacterium]